MSACLNCGYVDMHASGVGSIAMSEWDMLLKRSKLLDEVMTYFDCLLVHGALGDEFKRLQARYEKVGGAVAAPPKGDETERITGKEL